MNHIKIVKNNIEKSDNLCKKIDILPKIAKISRRGANSKLAL
jgi:hypothetical protein